MGNISSKKKKEKKHKLKKRPRMQQEIVCRAKSAATLHHV